MQSRNVECTKIYYRITLHVRLTDYTNTMRNGVLLHLLKMNECSIDY